MESSSLRWRKLNPNSSRLHLWTLTPPKARVWGRLEIDNVWCFNSCIFPSKPRRFGFTFQPEPCYSWPLIIFRKPALIAVSADFGSRSCAIFINLKWWICGLLEISPLLPHMEESVPLYLCCFSKGWWNRLEIQAQGRVLDARVRYFFLRRIVRILHHYSLSLRSKFLNISASNVSYKKAYFWNRCPEELKRLWVLKLPDIGDFHQGGEKGHRWRFNLICTVINRDCLLFCYTEITKHLFWNAQLQNSSLVQYTQRFVSGLLSV